MYKVKIPFIFSLFRNKGDCKDRVRRASDTFLLFPEFSGGNKFVSTEINLLDGTEETPKLILRSPSTDQEYGLKYSETLNTIVEDDDSISISSAVSSDCKSVCQNYICCEKESCNEEIVVLDQCPKESEKRKHSKEDVSNLSFSKIVLQCPSCHLDCLSILPEESDTLTLARIETSKKMNPIKYSCCDDELCREETVSLERCPNDPNSEHSEEQCHDDEAGYKIKDLPNFLGMKEVVPTSVDTPENKILRKLSSSLKIRKQKHRDDKDTI